jgi:hypothetical protein
MAPEKEIATQEAKSPSEILWSLQGIAIEENDMGNRYAKDPRTASLGLGFVGLFCTAMFFAASYGGHLHWSVATIAGVGSVALIIAAACDVFSPKWLRRWKRRRGLELQGFLKEVEDFNEVLEHRQRADYHLRNSVSPELYAADVAQLAAVRERLEERRVALTSEIEFALYDKVLSDTGSSEGYTGTKDLSVYAAAAQARHRLEDQ